MSTLMIVLLTATAVEILLLGCVVWFFLRLRRSESLLIQLKERQKEFMDRLSFNTRLEHELVSSFETRQRELASLLDELEQRERLLKNLLKQAEELNRSPQFLRQIVLAGHRKGKSVSALARATGLSTEEIELIINLDRG